VPGPASIAVVVGNPKAGSRTLGVATELAQALQAYLNLADARLVVDLAEHGPRIFDQNDASLNELTATVAATPLVVLASPTYKASYTGLLKAFLDRYENNALAGVVAVPLMMGAGPTHALAPEVHLRPVLVELGAAVPTRALYVMESQITSLAPVVSDWLDAAGPLLRGSLSTQREDAQ
jgi:FMN reductase